MSFIFRIAGVRDSRKHVGDAYTMNSVDYSVQLQILQISIESKGLHASVVPSDYHLIVIGSFKRQDFPMSGFVWKK